jgi:hypothetical protein
VLPSLWILPLSQDSCLCQENNQSLVGGIPWIHCQVKKTQLNQEEKQEIGEPTLCFHPLAVFSTLWYNLDTVSPASKSQGCHRSSDPTYITRPQT